MKPTILPTSQVSTDAEILPFKKVAERKFPELTQQCLDLLDSLKARILSGEESPTALVLCVVETCGETEKSFALSSGLSRMEIIGNLYALATELTVAVS